MDGIILKLQPGEAGGSGSHEVEAESQLPGWFLGNCKAEATTLDQNFRPHAE